MNFAASGGSFVLEFVGVESVGGGAVWGGGAFGVALAGGGAWVFLF